MTSESKGELVIQRLESLFGHVRFNDDFWRERKEPFWLIVDTILSQNVLGIGPKTADVVLLFARDFDIIPVDTHVFRVSRRLGLAPQKGGYEIVKTALEDKVPRGKRKFAHVALIKFGREICSARQPQHWKCPLTDVCTYYQEMSSDAT